MKVAVEVKRVGDHFEVWPQNAAVKRKLFGALKRGESMVMELEWRD